MALSTLHAVRPLLGSERLLLALDDTPTARYGPCVEGAGIHHNPSPGLAGEKFVYGHVWVTLAALARAIAYTPGSSEGVGWPAKCAWTEAVT
jgi:hypothetical protein